MKCPTCDNEKLLMSERQGVEIDYCPSCRGVWLDRGELDKLLSSIERDDFRQHSYKKEDRERYEYKKRKSFLHELFD